MGAPPVKETPIYLYLYVCIQLNGWFISMGSVDKFLLTTAPAKTKKTEIHGGNTNSGGPVGRVFFVPYLGFV